jgi:hypothetical protein
MVYRPVIKRGQLENPPLLDVFPSYKTPFNSGIFQPAMFDYQRV